MVAVAIAAHFAIVSGSHESTVGAWLALIPVAALAVWAVRRSRRPRTTLVGVGATIVILWIGWPMLERNFPSLLFVEHAGANAVLAIVFGRTLLRNREALCTRFARALHDTLPREVERYTRLVTLAWTIFFGAVFVLSCGLYLGGYLAAWSLLANILSPGPYRGDVPRRISRARAHVAGLGAHWRSERHSRVRAAFRNGATRGASLSTGKRDGSAGAAARARLAAPSTGRT